MIKKILSKIQRREEIQHTVDKWKKNGEKIVFTNGCFDLLHYGHVHYLATARGLGDKLVIGMNSSASVARLKGKHRPIKDEKTRSAILASLQYVDAVVIFDEDTPLDLIKAVMPDILVKGGDWKPEQIVGSDVIIANGGIVKSLQFIEGYSTTLIEEKIKNQA